MSIQDQLLEFQIAQLRHDEIAHRDILCLPTQDRIKHMVLHFSKYAGRLAELQESKDEGRFIATLVDTFIICLVAANTLGMRLEQKLNDLNHEKVKALKADIGNFRGPRQELSNIMFLHLAKITGEMAKACESMDHLENFNYRGTLESGIEQIAVLSLSVADILKIDLSRLVTDQWEKIERRSIFYKEVASPRNNGLLHLAANKR